MPLVHHARKEVHLKVVYYGPAQSGKTTNLEQVHVLTHRKLRITIATAEIRKTPASTSSDTYDCLAWKGVDELSSLAMSSLARKVLLACKP